jgi:hypothetical protein
MKAILILLFITSCWNDPEETCYHCQSPIMQDVYFCGYTPDEMQNVIDWRAEHLGDTLVCEIN